MERRLAGKRAMVTGAGRGIGKAIASRLAAEGAVVCLNDIDREAISATAKNLDEAVALSLAGDLSVEGTARMIAAAIEAELGGLDILVNNAGVGVRATIEGHDADTWSRTLAVNLTAPFALTRALLPALRRGSGAAVVNICSLAVIGLGGQVAYEASKGGLLTLTRSLAAELGPEGIRANAVCPGLIRTPMTADVDEAVLERQARAFPLRRIGEPEDVAAAVAWLASDDASYITGQQLFVDGGWFRG